MIACENSGHNVSDDFPEVRKIVVAGVASGHYIERIGSKKAGYWQIL